MSTPTSSISGNLAFDFRRYEEDSDLDEDNTRFEIRSLHKMQRSRVGLDLDFVDDTTLDSQLEATGVVFDRNRRQRLSASPSWTYSINERAQLSALYTYTDVNYDNSTNTAYVDYTLNSARLSVTGNLNERSTGSITLSGTRSENDNHVETTNINLQVGASYEFSETVSGSLYAGVRRTQADYSQTSLIPIFSGNTLIGFYPLTQDITKSDWGYTFSGTLTKSFLRAETGLSASQDISNDINGAPIEVSRLRWLNRYRLSETLTANLNINFYYSRRNNAIGNNLNTKYLQAEPTFAWRFRKFWSLSASYRYRIQTYDNTNDEAVQNAAYLTLIYDWPRIAVSR